MWVQLWLGCARDWQILAGTAALPPAFQMKSVPWDFLSTPGTDPAAFQSVDLPRQPGLCWVKGTAYRFLRGGVKIGFALNYVGQGSPQLLFLSNKKKHTIHFIELILSCLGSHQARDGQGVSLFVMGGLPLSPFLMNNFWLKSLRILVITFQF